MSNCELCGHPLPAGEEMFKYHGFSGSCPEPALPRPPAQKYAALCAAADELAAQFDKHLPEAQASQAKAHLAAAMITARDSACPSCLPWPLGVKGQ